MEAGTPGMWNQLRFNVDQAPSLANLVSHVSSRRPGHVLLGHGVAPQFTVVDPATLAIAQRLARRDVARMREPPRDREPREREKRADQHRSPSPSPPPLVARPCRRESERQQQQQARQEQRQKSLQHRRPLPAAQPRSRTAQLASLPARGESPPMRDTDPQPNYPVAGRATHKPLSARPEQQRQLAEARAEMREIRAQHQQMLAALRDLAKGRHHAQDSPTPSDRSQPQPAKPRVRLQTRRTKLWGGPAPSSRQADKPHRPLPPASSKLRPLPQKKTTAAPPPKQEEEDEDEEEIIHSFRAPRLLNEPASSDPASADGILAEVRRLLMESRATRPKIVPVEIDQEEEEEDEEEEEEEEEEDLPGAYLALPSLDEMAHRMEQIEADANAIRERWRTLQFEDVESEASGPALPLDDQAMLFTKLPAKPAVEAKKMPRPPTTVPVMVPAPAVRSIEVARQRFLDWSSNRPGLNFSVELPRIADWIAEDIVEEMLLDGVTDIDRAGGEIVQLLLEREMATGHSDSEEDEEEDFDASEQ